MPRDVNLSATLRATTPAQRQGYQLLSSVLLSQLSRSAMIRRYVHTRTLSLFYSTERAQKPSTVLSAIGHGLCMALGRTLVSRVRSHVVPRLTCFFFGRRSGNKPSVDVTVMWFMSTTGRLAVFFF